MSEKRQYRMNERARSQEETRLRIVEATMQLHEEIGARATTISAIAERAGVQRLTVYRHFADETAVFQACTSHWLSLNPPPDPAAWQEVEAGEARAIAAITAFYGYYAGTRRMWSVSFRDVEAVPALQGPMAQFGAYVTQLAADLTAGFGAHSQHMIGATMRHLLHFPTWQHFEELGLDPAAKLALVGIWLRAAVNAAMVP